MTTNKMYYLDSYLQNFTTKLVQQKMDEFGGHYVILEDTAFYPTGGGQPNDIGTINNIEVTNVEEIDGEIRHYTEGPISGIDIIGSINWGRRFDHMQQHAGQHILSGVFSDLFGYETVSFHLGKETLTIDLEVEELTEAEVNKAELIANETILSNKPIHTKWVSNEEVSNYSLRKQPSVTEDIRLVIIPDFDYNACGGTHPNSTSEVGTIKVLEWERQKKKVRIHFICGGRVLSQFHKKNIVLNKIGQLMNTSEQGLVTSVERLLGKNTELEKSLEQARDVILQYEARAILNNNNNKIISMAYHNRTMQELQKLARYLVNQSPEVIVVLVNENENKLKLVLARGENRNINMGKLLGEVLPLINGKGGGNESVAQGAGERILTGNEVLTMLLEKINI